MNNNIVIYSDDFKAHFEAYRVLYPGKQISECPDLLKCTSVQGLLTQLASMSLDDSMTTLVYYSLTPVFIDVVSRLIADPGLGSLAGSSGEIPGSSVLNCLGKIVGLSGEFGTILEYFLERQQFSATVQARLSSIGQGNLQMILLAFYRLVNCDRDKFKRFVEPVLLYEILQKLESTSVNKYLAIQLLYIVLELAESVKVQMIKIHIGTEPITGYYEGDSEIDYTFLPLLEAQRLSNFTHLPNLPTKASGTQFVIKQSDLTPNVVSICGVLIPTFNNATPQESSIVPITKTLSSLKQLAENIQSSKPMMLVGKTGTGKTFVINELLKLLRRDSQNAVIKIHLNDQTDAKILLGTYTSGSKPGTFIWKSGVLTTAVKEGKWVLIEDIDKLPTEVLSILLTLLEKKELTIPSRGEVIKAANGFQLISTVRLTNDSKEFTVHDMIGMRMWGQINMQELDNGDLMSILQYKFPSLSNFLDRFIKMFEIVSEIYNSKRFIVLNKGSQPRPVSVRDFVKFCSRVNKILLNNGVTSDNSLITNEIYDMIFEEAADCFTSSIVEETPFQLLITDIGQLLEVATSRIQLFLKRNIPIFEEYSDELRIGRAILRKNTLAVINKSVNSTSFAKTGHSLRLMEQIGVSISMCEPVLLVGETGTGKTTVVQQVAKMLHKKLTVINVSQQTEIGDLLGGYKPVNTKVIALPIQESFEELFNKTFSLKKNAKFMSVLSKCFNKSQWKNVSRLWKEAYKMSISHLDKKPESNEDEATPKKKRRLNTEDRAKLKDQWENFYITADNFEKQSMGIDNAFAFQFVEGSLVKAVRNGDWLLLDEINLATPETLETIADLLSEELDQRNVLLSEKGDIESVKADKDFRLFGCMNPSTDVGKRDLPVSIRSRFTEIYVQSPDRDITDLLMIIDKYIGKFSVGDEWCGNDIAQLYLAAKDLAESNRIVDGANQKPHFSIRTLTRTLIYVCDIVSIYGLRRSLYEGFCMSFLTLLDAKSEEMLKPLIEKYTIARLKNAKSVMRQIPIDPSDHDKRYVQFRHYWMKHGPMELNPQPHYIITPFVEKNMLNLVRATSGRRFPVLIQGPTSSGKTSMIHYLANITGHKFVRINNHEHTDLQEYLGTYMSDEAGKLVFKEGILVEALRKGYWIVLDELNLAPTDVLEALNRLLDDNRELFIPETQEFIHPHPDFMLFATQNPPGLYGGRKILSSAFRNRFLELHFDDIPQDELETILKERCQIAPSYGKKIVEVYRQLSIQRQATRFMEQGNSFATLRDLFRWAQREAVGYEQLAANGYMLLAERVRRPDERLVVKEVIEKVMRVKLDMNSYYHDLENNDLMKVESSVVWTKAMRRLSVLVSQALQYNEPILLVGETGCGKTTICQLIADFTGRKLVMVNAHQNTETGDILGAQRPLRNRSELHANITLKIHAVLNKEGFSFSGEESFEELCRRFDSIDSFPNTSDDDLVEIKNTRLSANILFEWSDGPLIQAMKEGEFFLLDEISLADDSVLERLNSVLEPERSLLLAEKGTDDAFITAAENFKFLATMNPGGDYGKKELSPALRNRFTEIWVPSMDDFDDVRQIVSSTLSKGVKDLTNPLVLFSEWFGKSFGGGNASSGVISLRDILAWVNFINACFLKTNDSLASLLHGASMVFIDALGTNNTAFLAENELRLNEQKRECVKILSNLVNSDLMHFYLDHFEVVLKSESLKCGLFEIPRIVDSGSITSFSLHAPTTAANAMRVVRAMQVHKPILLEGSPGVGKTSLISALANATGNNLTRINLSEQTDLIDLFGSDAPAEGGETGEFVWRDAPFLRAMQRGEWVLLDEMNLANQSVLEGLNACLDHRGEAYIPELDKSFSCHPNFLVFAAQNPQYQGGGRKGLPKSFVNRFSVVYVDMLKAEDLNLIANHLYPNIEPLICSKLITFISKLEEQVVIKKLWGSLGAPWEFNLRDTLRWLDLLNSKAVGGENLPADFFDIIVGQRFRSSLDRESARELFKEVFGSISEPRFSYVLGENFLQAGNAVISRKELIQVTPGKQLFPLGCMNKALETMLTCINHSWPLILTGPSGSGKTELIRFTAAVVGAKIDEFSMNSEVDSMDILGGYEQVDLTRKVIDLSDRLKAVLLDMIALNLKARITEPVVIAQALQLYCYLNERIPSLEGFFELRSRLQSFATFVSSQQDIISIVSDADQLATKIEQNKSVKFEWFDGLLVQAVEKGNWLVLDNANLCNPSVLDRLNSLLEPNGSLIVNECSDSSGQPRIVQPHPNFRLFLTVDPKYGELSRAMRNRGIEMFLEKLEFSGSVFDKDMLNIDKSIKKGNDDIEGSLSLLKIKEDGGKPVSSFLSCTESYLRSYFVISDVIMRSTEGYEQQLSSILTGILPFVSDGFNNNWINTVTRSSEFSKYYKAISTQIFDRIEFLKETGLISGLFNIDGPGNLSEYDISMTEFKIFQSLNPLLNSAMIPRISLKSKSIGSSEPFYFFAVAFDVLEATLILEKLESKSLNGKLSDLTYIEKSAAISLGRNLKGGPQLNIYGLIKELFMFMRSSLFQSMESDLIFQLEAFYEKLFEIFILWKNALKCSENKNESRLRVYQQLIDDWILENRNADSNNSLFEKLKALSSSLNTTLSLTSGFSILLIWEHSRAQYPISEEGWLNRESLEKLADEFDSVIKEQFPENNPTINDMRKLMVELYADSLQESQDGFEIIFSDISKGVLKLKDISSRFLNKREHFFLNEFNMLINFMESYAIFNDKVDYLSGEYLNLFSLTGKPTSLLVDANRSLFKPYPKIFDYLWESPDTLSVKELFSNQIAVSVINSSVNFEKVGAAHIYQSMSDLSNLGSALLHNSNAILAAQYPIFKRLIKDWYLEMASIHLDELSYGKIQKYLIADSFLSEDFRNLLNSVSGSSSPEFQNISEKFFFPALLLISSDIMDCKILGLAWILFTSGCIQLFVPSSPLDPAVKEYVLFDVNNTKIHFTESFSKAWADFVEVSNATVEDIPKSSVEKLTKPRVFRPQESCDLLFDTWTSFSTSSIDEGSIKRLTEVACSLTENALQQVDLFQKNSSLFILRVSSQFSRYSDLNEILKGFILGLKVGFELLSFQMIKLSDEKKLLDNWSIDVLSLTSPSKTSEIFNLALEFCKSQTASDLIAERVLTFFMRLFFVHNQASTYNRESLSDMVHQTFQGLYYRWTLRRMKLEEEAAANSSLYRHNDFSADLEEDFKSLFPDFEDIMNIESGVINADATVIEDTYFEIAKLYIHAFSNEKQNSLEDILTDGSHLSSEMSKLSHGLAKGTIDSSQLSVMISQIYQSLRQFQFPTKNLDFYRGFSPVETKKAVEIVERIQGSVHSLLLQWPEHATLQNIFRSASDLLSFPSNTPVAKLLMKVEQIYTFIAEWEKYSHSKISLKLDFDQLTNLIISWRKLELSTWKSLFEFEEKTLEKNTGKWWFYLFETIIIPISNQDESVDEVKLLGAINVFLSQTTHGEFGYRLTLLKSFREHLKLLYKDHFLLNSISNIITFYEQFKTLIETHISTTRKTLERSIDEVILLASWKDVNIDALKQSARRSHQSLYKIVRKYRALLSEPISQLIELGVPLTTKQIVPKFSFRRTTLPNVDISLVSDKATTIFPPNRNFMAIDKKMNEFVKSFEDEDIPSIYEFSKDLCESMDQLKKETPSKFTEEAKKDIAALKNQKRKLLSDTLKELRRMGLKSHLSEEILKPQSSINLLLARTETTEGTILEGTDSYFYRILDLMPRLRSSLSNCAEDVPVTDAQKGLSMAEHLLSTLISTRSPLLKLATFLTRMQRICSTFEYLSSAKSMIVASAKTTIEMDIYRFENFTYWLPKICDHLMFTIKSAEELSKTSVSSDILINAKTTTEQFASKFNDLTYDDILTIEQCKILDDFKMFLESFVSDLQQWKQQNYKFSFVAETLIQWINTRDRFTDMNHNSQIDEGKIDMLETASRNLVTSIIVCVQRIVELQESIPLDLDEDNSFRVTQQKLLKYSQLLLTHRITSRLEECLKITSTIEHNRETSEQVSSYFYAMLPFLNHYTDLLSSLLNKYRQNYVENSHGAFMMSVALYNLTQQGFCSPEPTEDQRESDNMQDGTGLGDGEGAQNNSNDVEDDEDLSEYAQQPNEEQKEKDEAEDNDDDAVDIEGDMAGELEEAPNESDNSDDEADSNDEELDEEVDDIDDLDPNAIDDKMWDEEAQDNSKEKDSEKMPEDSNENDDMKANEDEDENNEKDDQSLDKADNRASDEQDNDEHEEDEDADEEEDVGEQEDEVKNAEDEQLDPNTETADALELPEDMNLDSEEGEESEAEGDNSMDEKMDEDLDVDMDLDDSGKEEEEKNADNGNPEDDENENNEEELEEEASNDVTNMDDEQNLEEEAANEDEMEASERGDDPESEEELDLNNEAKLDTKDSEDAEQNAEAVDGYEDGGDDDKMDIENAAKQESGAQGEGGEAQADEEQQDIGASGSAQEQQQQDDTERPSTNDEAREEAIESLKELGDTMKEFHRRRQEIIELKQDDLVEQSAAEKPDEFQHLDGENSALETQALGAANKDQIQSIDEDMAIDEDEDDTQEIKNENEDNSEMPMKQEVKEEEDAETQELQEADADFNGQSKSAIIGERKRDEDMDAETFKKELEDDMDLDDYEEDMKSTFVSEITDDLPRPIDEARDLWRKSDIATLELSAGLCEQLRLILEPTLATKLKGDYKTGKRLNMKRIIPYIASEFRKDKIWLRRTKPSKRQYQIMIAVDDSKSMAESKAVDLAFESIALVSKALTQLESGGLSIVKFGGDTKVVHPFDKPFTSESGAKVFQWFDFKQTRTDIKKLCDTSLKLFDDARTSGNADLWQLEIIISDGVCEDHETIQRLVRKARDQKIMLVFVVIDGINSNESIMDMSQISYVPDENGKLVLKVDKYLETFPFEFYVVVHNVSELPEMLSVILRQYFSELASV